MAGGIVGAWVMSLVIDRPAGASEAGHSDTASLSRDLQALAAEISGLRRSIDAQGHPPTTPEQVPDGTANPRPLIATPDTVYVVDPGIERWSWMASEPSQGLALDFYDGHVITFR